MERQKNHDRKPTATVSPDEAARLKLEAREQYPQVEEIFVTESGIVVIVPDVKRALSNIVRALS